MYFPIGWSKSSKIHLKSDLDEKINNLNLKFKLNENLEEKHKINGNLIKNEDEHHENNNDKNVQDFDEFLILLKTNADKSFLCILTNLSLRIWFCKPSVEIVCHIRNKSSLQDFGFNLSAAWKPNSSMVIVQTSKNFLLLYKLIYDYDSYDLFVQNNIGLKNEQFENLNNERIPSLFLELCFFVEISTGISSIMAVEEKTIVCTKQGEIIGVDWDGTIDHNFHWNLRDRYFSVSNHSLNKSDEFFSDVSFYVVNIEYSSDIGGFSLVFANGKAAFLPLKNEDEETSDKKYSLNKLQFVNDVNNAVTTAINHKYQILAFGLKNSEAILCCLDELTSNILITHHLSLSSSSFPNANNVIGSLCCLQWSPDSSVLAASWEKGGFVIWSVFGALLSCSLNWDCGTTGIQNKYRQNIYSSLSWGKEGYQLWMIEKNLIETCCDSVNLDKDNEIYDEKNYRTSLSHISFAKSILASNPSCISNCGEFVLLISEDRLFLGIEATSAQNYFVNDEVTSLNNNNFNSTNAQTSNENWKNLPNEIGNHQWIIIPMPSSYCNLNSPIRYATIDKKGQHIAIAGKNGFALYSMSTKKWKIFGNETQERDFEVCGGLLWFKDYIVMGSYNLVETYFELRVYPQREKLDNQNAKIIKVPCDILLLSIHKNRLLVFFIDGSFYLYAFYDLKKNQQLSSSASSSFSSSINSKFVNLNNKKDLVKNNSSVSIHLILMNQIVVSNIIISPECVTSIILSSLNFESCSKQSNGTLFNDLILMNICGRLFLLEIDYNETTNINKKHQQNGLLNGLVRSQTSNGLYIENENSSLNSKIILVYKVVCILASGVENVWVNNLDEPQDIENRPHLSNALWLSCGMNGMGVSLPLLPSVNEKTYSQYKSFIAKRIMLPINTHIYPLAILFQDALVMGAENDTILCGKSQFLNKPFNIVSKTSQVYLHHILRELLRRNLGMHAWEIANSCTTLPYFSHSLELLLHGVLEEEATSSQAIPDPLLPRVIQFIREFPVFLETVVHCTRKTELALWPHLFSVVGNPKDLFEQCLENDNLSTAASYIIVLHNLEKTSISKQYASTLLKKVSDKGEIELFKDLLRFLNAIEPSEQIASSSMTKK